MQILKSDSSVNDTAVEGIVQSGNNNRANINNLDKSLQYVFNDCNVNLSLQINSDKDIEIESIKKSLLQSEDFKKYSGIQQENISKILSNTLHSVEYEEIKNNKEPDLHWMLNFFESAKNICSEDIQYIFSKILAGEIKNPNSYSLRTLETLKCLSKEEAEKFVLLSNCVFILNKTIFFIFEYNDLLKIANLEYADLIKLENANLITTVTRSIDNNVNEKTYLKYADKIVLIEKQNTSTHFNPNIFTLTVQGIDIYNALEGKHHNYQYLVELSKKLKGYTITTYDGRENSDGSYKIWNMKQI